MSLYYSVIEFILLFTSVVSIPLSKRFSAGPSDLDGSYFFDESSNEGIINPASISGEDTEKNLNSENTSNEENSNWMMSRNERNERISDSTKLKYLAKYLNCLPNCPLDNKNYEILNKYYSNGGNDQTISNILSWTTKQLENLNGLEAEGGYSGVNVWKSVNLSGRREGPLYAEEPHYVLVRREEFNPKFVPNEEDVPFIPPRGRKHGSSLSELINKYEVFVPNRGKKDKIKDIFKYDDLFFPNRGKKEQLIRSSKWIKSSENFYNNNRNNNNNDFVNCEERKKCNCITTGSQQTICKTIQSISNRRINHESSSASSMIQ